MKHKLFFIFFLLVILLGSCNDKNNGTQPDELSEPIIEQPGENKPELLENVSEEGRVIWQKPEDVVKLLGDISDKTIADIGAGSGYFTFRFALKAKKVIAIDIDPTMIQILETFRRKLPEEIQDKIETRLALPNDPLIKEGEVDIIVIINTIGYINNRVDYLRRLKTALKDDGQILIIDFKAKNIPINAPAMEYRVPLGTLESDLAKSGYQIIISDDRTLNYQYITIAGK